MARRISILTLNQLDWTGSKPITGGLERYGRDLALTLRSAGYDVDIVQYANGDWEREMDGIPIHGLDAAHAGYAVAGERMNARVAGHAIYLSITMPINYRPGSIAVCHGIWWDVPGDGGPPGPLLSQALNQSVRVVSVDLNFIGFVRATWPGEWPGLIYIPNYVDVRRFHEPDGLRRPEPLRVLYPHRLDQRRGIYTWRRIVQDLLQRHPDVIFEFAVDQNHDSLSAEHAAWLQSLTAEQRARVPSASHPFDEMPEVHRRAHIFVCPSPGCQGTSLSLLEAMASGSAILTTNVGGIGNLVLPGFNGMLVPPDAAAIRQGVEDLIMDDKLRDRLSWGGVMAAKAFRFERWQAQWRELVHATFGPA